MSEKAKIEDGLTVKGQEVAVTLYPETNEIEAIQQGLGRTRTLAQAELLEAMEWEFPGFVYTTKATAYGLKVHGRGGDVSLFVGY